MADRVTIFPAELPIPLPQSIQRGSGITSAYGPHGCYIIYRGLVSEREKLHEAAALLGISYAAFVRCLVNDAADMIIKMHRENQASEPNQVVSEPTD